MNGYKIVIEENLEKAERCIYECVGNTGYRNALSLLYDKLIDHFLKIHDLIKISDEIQSDQELFEYFEIISKKLVDGVEAFKQIKMNNFVQIIDEIQKLFPAFKDLILKKTKYKVLVLVKNPVPVQINLILDSNKTNVVLVVDIEACDQLSSIMKMNRLDYIINLSDDRDILQKSVIVSSIEQSRLLNYHEYINLYLQSPEFSLKYYAFLAEKDKKYTGIITGLSYVQKGVNERVLIGRFLNWAFPGQDLFYDFEMFKHVFSVQEVKENLQYAILGLSYYSFHYDLTKSANKHRVNYYFPLTRQMHNYDLSDSLIPLHQHLKSLEQKLLSDNHLQTLFDIKKSFYQSVIEESEKSNYCTLNRTDNELLSDIHSIKRDYNKNYPITVEENIKIITEYLHFLKCNNIKTILIIPPVTKLYQTFTPSHFKMELYKIIDDLKKIFKLQVLDYYDSNNFDDSDFYDPSHINNKGATKLGMLLNRDIDWS